MIDQVLISGQVCLIAVKFEVNSLAPQNKLIKSQTQKRRLQAQMLQRIITSWKRLQSKYILIFKNVNKYF